MPSATLEKLEQPIHELKFTDRQDDVPSAALDFTAAEFAVGDNGDNAKSAPVHIVARSPGVALHWYWGRCVHDLTGMKMHKSKLPIDYCHDYADVLGYLNKFEVTDKGLEASGALVPFKDSDRATEVIHKQKGGVPYEASITASFEGMVIEEVNSDAEVEVNGQTFTGPLIVFRQWHLRGVAICPYGADMNTASEFKAHTNAQNRGDNVPVKFTNTTNTQENDMADEPTKNEETTENAEANEAVDADEKDTGKTDEADKAVDADKAGEGADTGDAEADKAVEVEGNEDVPAGAGDNSARNECKKFIDAFGAAGGEWFAAGKTFAEASKLHMSALSAENDKLKARLDAAGEGEAEPVDFQADGKGGDKANGGNGKFSYLPDGLATYASNITLPQNKK